MRILGRHIGTSHKPDFIASAQWIGDNLRVRVDDKKHDGFWLEVLIKPEEIIMSPDDTTLREVIIFLYKNMREVNLPKHIKDAVEHLLG